MLNFTYNKIDSTLQIDQNQVDKFYQERQIIKKQMFLDNDTKSKDNGGQPAFKNLFRRKSLANKIKQDSSMFNSFNNSIDNKRTIENKLISKQSSLKKLHHSFRSVDIMKDCNQIDFAKKYNFSQNPNQESQINVDSEILHQVTQKQIKKRCNSVQFQNFSYSMRNHSRKSLQNLKPLKETVPLSSILRKYQQEVNKIQKQGIDVSSEQDYFQKTNMPLIFSNEKNTQNTKNHSRTNRDKSTLCQQNFSMNESIKLPQAVEKCIDKWKNLQIQQLKAEKELKNQKQTFQIKEIQTNKLNEKKVKNFYQQLQKKDTIQKIKFEYEQKLRQQQEKLDYLQKQNCQYKKFVGSIQKMKATVEKYENAETKFDNKLLSNKKEVEFENEVNLKQLWRWIKSLPSIKNSKKTIERSIR